jgi:hypothetical protein
MITLPINEKSSYLIPKEFYPVKVHNLEGDQAEHMVGDFIKDWGHCKYYTVKSSLVKSQAYSKTSKFA